MDYKAALLKGLKEIPSTHTRPKLDLHHTLFSQDPPAEGNCPNLPRDVMLLILQRVGWFDVLTNVKEVCKYWYMLSKDPSLWRVTEFRKDALTEKLRKKIGMRTYEEYISQDLLSRKAMFDFHEYETKAARILERAMHKMVMDVIDLSCGQLRELVIQDFGSDNLFKYIYRRSRQLRRLRLEECFVCCYNYESIDHDRCITLKGMVEMLKNLPLLEELELPYTRIFGKGIRIVGRHCPSLKSFTLNQRTYSYTRNPRCDKQALAIAKRMPGLRHLQLFGNRMTITGLMAILDNCHHLEYLDLRQCYGLCRILEDKPDLETKIRQQIKHVRFPQDSTEDYEFDAGSDCSDGYIGSDCSSELD